MRNKTLIGLAAVLFVTLVAVSYLVDDVPLLHRAAVPQTGRPVGQDLRTDGRGNRGNAADRMSGSPVQRATVPLWVRGTGKRTPAAQLNRSQVELLTAGWREADAGKYVAARVKFQTMINEYGGPGSAYALLAISETYVLEGGEEQLQQALAGYRDFLVFFPDHDLAPQARARAAELGRALRAPGIMLPNPSAPR